MVPDAAVLDRLRARLSEVESRHESDAQGAAQAFWASLRGHVDAAPAQATPSGQGRRGGPKLPAVGGIRRCGPWAQVDPDGPLPVDPLEVVAVDPEALDLDGADAGWLEALLAQAEARLDTGEVERPEPVAVKIDALLGASLVSHGSAELALAVEHVAAARAQHEVVLVNVLAELEARGEQPPGGLRPADWLRSVDPGMSAGQAKDLVTVARAVNEPRWRELRARVTMQHVTVAKAARIVEFDQRVSPVADPEEVDGAVTDLLGAAPGLVVEDFTRLVRHHTEQVRPPKDEGDEERVDAGRRSARGLWFGQPNRTGMVSLRGVLDPEAAAVLKSAIAPLAAPCPERDGHGHTVSPDPRSPAKRRADALVEIVERGVAAAADLPVTDKAKLVVTLDHEVLTGRIRGTGLAGSGDVITAAAVRRLACDAAIIPMVLGGAGEPLDVGRARRLVTAAMRAALWQRDAGCTFPGCTAPAQWTDAHHVTPWWGGGPTSMDNLALLCRRHHTHVHRHELTATVTPTGVTWHT